MKVTLTNQEIAFFVQAGLERVCHVPATITVETGYCNVTAEITLHDNCATGLDSSHTKNTPIKQYKKEQGDLGYTTSGGIRP
jgi:hypothetical protein